MLAALSTQRIPQRRIMALGQTSAYK